MNRKFYLLLLLFFGIPLPAHAIKVGGLYQASVPVVDESSQGRASAVKDAMLRVLIKLTGDPGIGQNTSAGNIIQNAENYVLQFRYQQDENGSANLSKLTVQFDENALLEAIRNQGITVWSNERPLTLVWLVKEVDGNRSIIGPEDSPEIVKLFNDRANERGIKLLFPLLDLQDSAKITGADLWAGFKDPINEASKRYQADVILVSKLKNLSNENIQAEWELIQNTDSQQWSGQAGDIKSAIYNGVDKLSNTLATRYTAANSGNSEVIQILVTAINTLDQYGTVSRYLNSLQSISSVKVLQVNEGQVKYELVVHGGSTAFEQSISLSKTLERIIGGDLMTYRLLR